jgi:hypothetical protein
MVAAGLIAANFRAVIIPRWPAPHDPDDVPHEKCSCGIYARHFPRDPLLLYTAYATGVIEAWGKTEIGTRGFRAQMARIVALHVPPTFSDNVGDNLSGLYKVPLFRDKWTMLDAFPPVDVTELIGPFSEKERCAMECDFAALRHIPGCPMIGKDWPW